MVKASANLIIIINILVVRIVGVRAIKVGITKGNYTRCSSFHIQTKRFQPIGLQPCLIVHIPIGFSCTIKHTVMIGRKHIRTVQISCQHYAISLIEMIICHNK